MAGEALTAAELTQIRADVETLMPDTCTIQSMSLTNNAVGEPARSYSNRGTAIICRIDPEIAFNAFEYLGGFSDTIKYTGRFILTLKHDQTVTISDRVIANGTTYEVVSIDPGKSWKASTRATLVEVSP